MSAIATAIATMVAFLFSFLAWGAPEREAKRARREATLEVLRATDETLELFDAAAGLVNDGPWDDDELSRLRARAIHGKRALEQLIQRPSLSDGAIFTGAGAIALLDLVLTVESQREAFARATQRLGTRREGLAVRIDERTPAKQIIQSGMAIREVTADRAERVRAYMSGMRRDPRNQGSRTASPGSAPRP